MSLIELVARYPPWHGAAAGNGAAADVVVVPGVIVAYAEDEVLLATVENRIGPRHHRREAVERVRAGAVVPLGHVAQSLVVAQRGVVKLADVVVHLISLAVFAELIQIIHHAALRHTACRGRSGIGIVAHD